MRLWLVTAALFVAGRLLYRVIGVRFDATALRWLPHYLDPRLLRVYLALGALLYVTLVVLMREVGVSTTTAVTVASLCALSYWLVPRVAALRTRSWRRAA